MGAIAAHLSSSSPADAGVIDRMLDAVPHRGTTRRVHTQGRCVVGVTFSEDLEDATIATENGVTVAVSGRIDNLDELRASFCGQPDRSPAAVVLTAFRALGDKAPNRLRGVFAGVVTDGSAIRAFRDHVGFEPLFYRDQGPDVFVATEAKQVIAGSRIPREPDRAAVEDMLFTTHSDQTICALRGVRRVPPATVLFAGPNGVRWSRYWEPADLLETVSLRTEEIQERFDALMRQAAARSLAGKDVLSLSGGIDSPAIAAYAAPEHQRLTGRPLAALSGVYPKFPRVDERSYVELVAKQLGMELHLYEPEVTPFQGLRELIKLCDGPAPSTTLGLAREAYLKARSLGFTTILTGEMAEYLIDVGQPNLVSHLLRNRRLSALTALFRSQHARGVALSTIGRQLARAILPGFIVDTRDRRRSDTLRRPDWLDAKKFYSHGHSGTPLRARWSRDQVNLFAVPSWSLESDAINQAASGVRVRRPWLDIDLSEFFLSLRAETKYPDLQPTKLFIRRLLRGKVPDAILDKRQKTYFDDWALSMIEYPFLRQLLLDPNERIAGVNYQLLGEHLRREDLSIIDYMFVRDLAAVHAFLES
jgi:asparagine synthase (glutamine-hydrolysing)